MKILKPFLFLFFNILCAIKANAQHSLQVGFGMHVDQFTTTGYIVEDSLLVLGDYSLDDARPTFLVLYNYPLLKRMNIEAGLKFYTTYNTYYAGLYDATFGFIKKGGLVTSNTFNIPVNLEYHIQKFFYLKGGISTSFCHLHKEDDIYFNDTPGVNEIYNKTKYIFKPVFLNYGLGAGIKIWKIDFSYYFSRSMTKISDPLEYEGNSYSLFQTIATHHLELTYHFDLKERAKE